MADGERDFWVGMAKWGERWCVCVGFFFLFKKKREINKIMEINFTSLCTVGFIFKVLGFCSVISDHWTREDTDTCLVLDTCPHRNVSSAHWHWT